MSERLHLRRSAGRHPQGRRDGRPNDISRPQARLDKVLRPPTHPIPRIHGENHVVQPIRGERVIVHLSPPDRSKKISEVPPTLVPDSSTQGENIPWLAGLTVGDYTLVHQVGQGTQGTVFEAKGLAGERVAIKLPNQAEKSKDLREEIERAQKFRKFDSLFLKGFIKGGTTPTPLASEDIVPYAVMELAQNGSLKDLLNSGRKFSYEEAGIIVAQIADAATAMEDQGYSHRDIKTENVVMVGSSDSVQGNGELEARLTDFGVSDELQNDGLTSGTTRYMAPEVLRGLNLPSSDGYAVGVLFYELVTGTNLFSSDWEQVKSLQDVRMVDNLEGYNKYKKYIADKLESGGIPDLLREPLEGVLALKPSERTTVWDFASQINTANIVLERQRNRAAESMEAPSRE